MRSKKYSSLSAPKMVSDNIGLAPPKPGRIGKHLYTMKVMENKARTPVGLDDRGEASRGNPSNGGTPTPKPRSHPGISRGTILVVSLWYSGSILGRFWVKLQQKKTEQEI